jgi:hypothetical protein
VKYSELETEEANNARTDMKFAIRACQYMMQNNLLQFPLQISADD